MGVVNTTYTFTGTDTITSSKLNNIIDDTKFTSNAISGSTLQVVSPGRLAVSAGGITSNELASNSVTTAKITNLNVTTEKIADANITTEKIANNSVTLEKLTGTTGTRPIQIVQSVKLDTQTIDTDSTSWVDVSSLSVTITRGSTTSKHRVQAAVNTSSNQANHGVMLRIVRDSTTIGVANADGSRVRATSVGAYMGANGMITSYIDFIDDTSAISDASITYKIQARIYSVSTGYINRSSSDIDNSDYGSRAISTITVTELG